MNKLFLILFCLSLNFYVSAKGDDYTVDRHDWNKEFKQAVSIHINNPFGNIYLKSSTDSTFKFHAVIQNHKSRKTKAHYSLSQKGKILYLNIIFPNNESINDERADISLLVPKTVSLFLLLNGGIVEAKKIISPLTVIGNSTTIKVKSRADVDLFTKHGTIFYKTKSTHLPINSKVKTYDGNITISYAKNKPYFEIINGNRIVSNSPILLNSQKTNKRKKHFNNPISKTKINIQSDTGLIVLIDTTYK